MSSNHSTKLSLAAVLAVGLVLLPLRRSAGQSDNILAYRHELYREDDNRMRVNTDTVLWDFGLEGVRAPEAGMDSSGWASHVRLQGNAVIDAISGASPTGAPPERQWPFPTFNDLYRRDYKVAYSTQYDQHYATFVAENQIYVDTGYETYQQMTNMAAQAAAQYAQGTAPTIASNSAAASFQSITNSPKIHRGTVPLAHLEDKREALSFGVPVTLGIHQVTPTVAYSYESDYKSVSGALNYSLALNQKNTILNAGFAHNADTVRDDRRKWQDKTTYDYLLGVVQLLDPKSYLTFNATYGDEYGYLSDPYRGVMPASNFFQTNPDDAALLSEKRPPFRSKEIAYLSYLRYFTGAHGSIECAYRFFHDSGDTFAHTVDLWWHQKIGSRIVLSPSFRYYEQSAAYFYYVLVPDFHALPKYYSADYRLSELQSFGCGLSLSIGLFKNASFDASYLRYMMEGLDHRTSQSAYPSANVFTAGLRIML